MRWFWICLIALAALAALAAGTAKTKNKARRRRAPDDGKRAAKGVIGEDAIVRLLERAIPAPKRILRNLYLPKPDGSTTELDVVMIHAAGLFVFESKNFSGWIFGHADDPHWTQCLPGSRGEPAQKERFYNPIRQNDAHLRHLRDLLPPDVPPPPLRSFIVFSDGCALKDVTPFVPGHLVTTLGHLAAALHATLAISPGTLPPQAIDRLAQILGSYAHPTDARKAAHVATLQAPAATPTQCPRCGAPLVARVAAKGDHAGQTFLGCSRFPKCHYTHFPDPPPQGAPAANA